MAHPAKYAKVERERRFFISRWPDGLTQKSYHKRITDHYLVGTSMRIRHIHPPSTDENVWKLTQKVRIAPDDCTRNLTTTFYLIQAEYEKLRKLGGQRLVKKRYPFVHEGRDYALDVFEEALDGLILAETECESEEEFDRLQMPSFASKDVSDDDGFTGAVLAEFQRKWPPSRK